MNRALMICDPSWSTGNIVKCLQGVVRRWHFDMFDWSQPFEKSAADGYDAVVSMSMTGAARNEALRQPGIAHACFGPGEMDLPEVKALELPPGVLLAGGSDECRELLAVAHPYSPTCIAPGFAHQSFVQKKRSGPYLRAGFVGFPSTQNIEVSGSVKRPEMFLEICRKAHLTPVFSEKNYAFECMQSFYDSIDVLISTSSREGGPFGPLEAIACGVPMLSTNVGLMKDIGFPCLFDTVAEAVALCEGLPRWAPALKFAQQELAAKHTKQAVWFWGQFLDEAAKARAVA